MDKNFIVNKCFKRIIADVDYFELGGFHYLRLTLENGTIIQSITTEDMLQIL